MSTLDEAEEPQTATEQQPSTADQSVVQTDFNVLDENIVGLPHDRHARTADVLRVIRILEDAEISCCFVGEYALIYYGAGRVPNVRRASFPQRTQSPEPRLDASVLRSIL